MVRLMVVGNVDPQTSAVIAALDETDHTVTHVRDARFLRPLAILGKPDLIIVAGWRRLIPPDILAIAPTIGFHSAKLPEYPGRAPVYWALVRGDSHTENTLLYLDEGVDSGDIIDSRTIALAQDMTPELVYQHMARTAAEMLTEHLPGILDGTAPRTPQDPARRGALTTKDGYARYAELRRLATGRV
jgi:methionyl-tRNA formyltransferase